MKLANYYFEWEWVDYESVGKKGRNKWNQSLTDYFAFDDDHFWLKLKNDFCVNFGSKMWRVKRCGIHHDGSDEVEWDKDLTNSIKQKINEEIDNDPNLF